MDAHRSREWLRAAVLAALLIPLLLLAGRGLIDDRPVVPPMPDPEETVEPWSVRDRATTAPVATTPLPGWPGFRGPTRNGVSPERGLPVRWGPTENVLWKVEIPRSLSNPYSSPVVWGDKVFITTSVDKPLSGPQIAAVEHHVLCFSVADGRKLWDCAVQPGWASVDSTGGFASSTPCTDGERIYVAFGSHVMAAVDLDGRLAWRTPIDVKGRILFGIASSPIVVDDLVILLFDGEPESDLLAFDRRSGKLRYDVPRPAVKTGCSPSPILAAVVGPCLIASSSRAIEGLRPADGAPIWSARLGAGSASPLFHDGVVFTGNGMALPLGADSSGDLKKHVRRLGVPSEFTSPVVAGGLLYTVNVDRIQAAEIATGKTVFTGLLAGATSYASPIATADGRILIASGGRSFVLKTVPAPEVIAVNDLDDPNHASAAVSGGRLFIRGGRRLWCIGAAAR